MTSALSQALRPSIIGIDSGSKSTPSLFLLFKISPQTEIAV
jgi:hypothetical protein